MNVICRIVNALAAPILLVLALCSPWPALAGDHGGAAGPEPMVFTVNLGPGSYLQFGLIFETASPEAAHTLASFKPMVQHEIILLLSGKDVSSLRTLAGKKELMGEIAALANHVIHEDGNTGIKEVLFTRFLIQ